MKFGINTFLFTSPFTNESIALFPMFRQWGFDSVEIAIEELDHINSEIIKRALDSNGLTCGSVCAAMGAGRDFRGTKEEQQNSMDYLKGVLDIMCELDCPVLAGPLYSTVGRAEAIPEEQYKIQWDTVVSNLQVLSDYAAQHNRIVAIEPLNRYETDFINTCDQAIRMVNDVGNTALRIHLDTFHMNIEEKDQAEAIIKAGPMLAHFHACGSDRGTPGNDQINWTKIIAALKQIDYTGNVVIESFTPEVKVIARAASIWRKIEPSPEAIALKGLKFLKSCFDVSIPAASF
jgi:D-psicose/D-tagatose/L-ribulose 3-epimerase